MTIPDKCINCHHAVPAFENVHDGWGKYHLDTVIRCDCFPAMPIVGCVNAEVYCEKKEGLTHD